MRIVHILYVPRLLLGGAVRLYENVHLLDEQYILTNAMPRVVEGADPYNSLSCCISGRRARASKGEGCFDSDRTLECHG